MGSISCDDALVPVVPGGGVTAVKIAVLAESDHALRGLLEPLSDRPIMTVRVDRYRDVPFDDPVPVRFARLDLDHNLLLYLFGVTRSAPTPVVDELLSGAVGVVFAGAARPEGLDLHGLPAVQAPTYGRVCSLGVVDRGVTVGRAKYPLTSLVQQAIARRRNPYPCTPYFPRRLR